MATRPERRRTPLTDEESRRRPEGVDLSRIGPPPKRSGATDPKPASKPPPAKPSRRPTPAAARPKAPSEAVVAGRQAPAKKPGRKNTLAPWLGDDVREEDLAKVSLLVPQEWWDQARTRAKSDDGLSSDRQILVALLKAYLEGEVSLTVPDEPGLQTT